MPQAPGFRPHFTVSTAQADRTACRLRHRPPAPVPDAWQTARFLRPIRAFGNRPAVSFPAMPLTIGEILPFRQKKSRKTLDKF